MADEKLYTTFAQYYDRIHEHRDYPKQVEYLVRLIDEFKLSRGQKVLDVCCGTGAHAGLMQEKGFDVTGYDLAEEMLGQATRKYPRVRFIRGDMRDLELGERFDVITCWFNSILYNQDPDQLHGTLSSFRRHLRPGGIAVFDMVHKAIGAGSRRQDYAYQDDEVEITDSHQWVYSPLRDILEYRVWLTIQTGGHTEEVFDCHEMGAFTFDEVRLMLDDIGFEVFVLGRDFDQIVDLAPRAPGAVFVARRK